MCFARAAVFYGLAIKARTLVVAAKAHQDLREPLLALDMIACRIETGTLETKTKVGAQKVPVEVWNLIKRALYPIALQKAYKRWIGSMKCGGTFCHAERNYHYHEDDGPPEFWFQWGMWGGGWQNYCEDCEETYLERISEADMGAGDLVIELLAAFGLVLPLDFHLGTSSGPIYTGHIYGQTRPIEYNPHDSERSWAVSLPLPVTPIPIGDGREPASKSPHVVALEGNEEDGGETSAMTTLSQAMLAGTSSNRRFEALIDLYEVFVVHTQRGVGSPETKQPQWRVGIVMSCDY
ncbi:hypothetical protein P7C70_g8817, partial [Phenoliferia sp. Uapishka_3]